MATEGCTLREPWAEPLRQHQISPKEHRTNYEEGKFYLEPYPKEVVPERRERESGQRSDLVVAMCGPGLSWLLGSCFYLNHSRRIICPADPSFYINAYWNHCWNGKERKKEKKPCAISSSLPLVPAQFKKRAFNFLLLSPCLLPRCHAGVLHAATFPSPLLTVIFWISVNQNKPPLLYVVLVMVLYHGARKFTNTGPDCGRRALDSRLRSD